jgi:hypothetical protein
LICLEIKNADTETNMEQIGDQVAKEQGQITADGAPTVLKTKTMIACTVCAYACTTCSMECQPRVEPQLSRPMTQ